MSDNDLDWNQNKKYISDKCLSIKKQINDLHRDWIQFSMDLPRGRVINNINDQITSAHENMFNAAFSVEHNILESDRKK